jgi:hypothetical protein
MLHFHNKNIYKKNLFFHHDYYFYIENKILNDRNSKGQNNFSMSIINQSENKQT